MTTPEARAARTEVRDIIELQHCVIGTSPAKQGAAQVVPEDSLLCVSCGWMSCTRYAQHLFDVLAASLDSSDLSEGLSESVSDSLTAPRSEGERAKVDPTCASCGEGDPTGECPKSKRSCGHHCNHIWENDFCDWCRFGLDEPSPAPREAVEREALAEAWLEGHGHRCADDGWFCDNPYAAPAPLEDDAERER